MTIQERQLMAGDIVFRGGDEPDGVYVVRQGSLEAFHTHKDEELIYAHFQTGDMFGELGVISGSPRSLTVRAISACSLDFIPREKFFRAFGGEDNIALPLLKLMCRRLRGANDMAGGSQPLKRRSKASKSGIRVRLKPGNVLVGTQIGDNPIRITTFPFTFGSSPAAATKIDAEGILFSKEAASQVSKEHAVLEIRDDAFYIKQGRSAGETHVNGERLSSATGRIESPMQQGLNVIVLGNETSPWRLLVEVRA